MGSSEDLRLGSDVCLSRCHFRESPPLVVFQRTSHTNGSELNKQNSPLKLEVHGEKLPLTFHTTGEEGLYNSNFTPHCHYHFM